MNRHHLGLLCIALFFTPGYLLAHDLKVFASQLVAKADSRTTVYLSWGHALPIDDLLDAKTIESYEWQTPKGSRTRLKAEGLSLQANVIEPQEEGIHQLLVARKASVITFIIDKEGNRVMKRGPKSAIKEGEIVDSRRSQQFAKALIVSGKSDKVPPSAGLPLEIVPLETPADWRPGLRRFQVLFKGKPVASETLTATRIGYKPDNAWCYSIQTDRKGVAQVRADEAGTWVLKVNVRRPASKEVKGDYDVESYTTTLVLEIQP